MDLLKRSRLLERKEVFDFKAPMYDDDLGWEFIRMHDEEFTKKKKKLITIDLNGNRLKKPILRYPERDKSGKRYVKKNR